MMTGRTQVRRCILQKADKYIIKTSQRYYEKMNKNDSQAPEADAEHTSREMSEVHARQTESFVAPSYMDKSVHDNDTEIEPESDRDSTEVTNDIDWYQRRLGRKNSTAHRSFMSNFSFINRNNLKRFSRSKITFLVIDLAVP